MEEQILRILGSINEDISSYKGGNLLEDEVIDSFDVMQIVAALEEEFNIEIDADYVIAENFASIQTIINMVRQCSKEC